jgi:hypothetical protein
VAAGQEEESDDDNEYTKMHGDVEGEVRCEASASL